MQEIRLQHVPDLDVCLVQHQPGHGDSNGSSEQSMAAVGVARDRTTNRQVISRCWEKGDSIAVVYARTRTDSKRGAT